jgi:hypothetical protein
MLVLTLLVFTLGTAALLVPVADKLTPVRYVPRAA